MQKTSAKTAVFLLMTPLVGDYHGGYPTQADMPSAPAIAEHTPMMILKMISHVLFSLFCSMFMYLVIISLLRRG